MSETDAGQRPGPHFRSRFGGLWTDLSNVEEIIDGKLELGRITEQQARQLRFWTANGYVVLEGAVSADRIDRVLDDVDRAWQGTDPLMCAEYPTDQGIQVGKCDPAQRSDAAKLLNMHAYSEAARDVIFAEPIRDFLQLVFERPPLAFSTLLFERGTQQPLHQDTAYVGVSSPLEFAASWVALEDIVGRCGRLEYFAGSHRIEETVFDGDTRLMPQDLRSDEAYFYHLLEKCQQRGLERLQFGPKKGDALIWAADLVHGGSQELEPGTSRRSLVTHYCPSHLEPEYFAFWEHSDKLRHAPGCYYCYYVR